MMNTDRRSVLILHGWMHSARRYAKLKDALEAYGNIQVTLYEFPGFGETPAKNRDKKHAHDIMAEYLEDLKSYLKSHHFDYIIGHSMGGNLALRAVAENHSQEALILLSPEYEGIALLKPLIFIRPLVRAALRFAARKNLAGIFFIKLASLLTVNKLSKIDDLMIRDAWQADKETAEELMFELAFDKWNVGPAYKPGRTMLLIIGEKDRIIPRSHMSDLKNHVAGCKMYVMKGIGHTAVLEDYEGLLKVLLRWVDKTKG